MLTSALFAVALASDTALLEAEWERDVPGLVALARSEDVALRSDVARALGRTRLPEALDPLAALARDPDAGVRGEALLSLAWVPGGGEPLTEALAVLPRHSGWGRADTAGELRGKALWALGHHASEAHRDVLVDALAETGPAAVGAALGLGRMGRDGFDGAKTALPALLGAAERDLGEVPRAAAYAAGRIGCDEANAPRAAARAARAPWSDVRAYLLRCAGAGLDADARVAAVRTAVSDPHAFVRVTAANLLREGDPVVLAADLLSDDDPGVRRAAVAALGRLGATSRLELLLATTEPYRLAEVIDAWLEAGGAVRPEWEEGELAVRVTLAAHATPERALALAESSPDAAVRSAAAGSLTERDEAEGEWLRWGKALVGSSDPTVRAVAVSLLAKAPVDEARSVLLPVARVENDPEVLGEVLAFFAASPWEKTPDSAAAVIRRARGLGFSRVARLASEWAAVLGLDVPKRQPDPRFLEAIGAKERVPSVSVETSKGVFTIDLRHDLAPLAAFHFARLASEGYFDGLVFHRIVPAFVVQTGCPRGDGWGGPGFMLPDEVSASSYDRGMVGMARGDRDTGGSQWFVTTTPQPHLTGDYTLFGEVTHGMSVVDALERGDRIEHMRVER